MKSCGDMHPTRINQNFSEELQAQYIDRAKQLHAQGCNRLVIGADGDSVLHKILSPRIDPKDYEKNRDLLLDIFQAVSKIITHVSVLLTVEDLAPGGLDATDGIMIANSLSRLGLTEIIATSGTKDFLPLYQRRSTQKKATQTNSFSSHEPQFAPAMWLLENTDFSVWCLAFIDDLKEATQIATSLNMKGLIQKHH